MCNSRLERGHSSAVHTGLTAKSPRASSISLSSRCPARFPRWCPTRSLDVPGFTFTDLRSTFEELFALLTSLLRASVREAACVCAMDVVKGCRGNLSDERHREMSQFVLAAHARESPRSSWRRDLCPAGKIGRGSSCRSSPLATRGLGLQVAPPAPRFRCDPCAYFHLDGRRRGRALAHILDGAQPPSFCRHPTIPRSSSSRLRDSCKASGWIWSLICQ